MIFWLLEKLAIFLILYSIWAWYWALSIIPQIILGVAFLGFVTIALFGEKAPPDELYLTYLRAGPTPEEIASGKGMSFNEWKKYHNIE